jgi:hypothetical protein
MLVTVGINGKNRVDAKACFDINANGTMHGKQIA